MTKYFESLYFLVAPLLFSVCLLWGVVASSWVIFTLSFFLVAGWAVLVAQPRFRGDWWNFPLFFFTIFAGTLYSLGVFQELPWRITMVLIVYVVLFPIFKRLFWDRLSQEVVSVTKESITIRLTTLLRKWKMYHYVHNRCVRPLPPQLVGKDGHLNDEELKMLGTFLRTSSGYYYLTDALSGQIGKFSTSTVAFLAADGKLYHIKNGEKDVFYLLMNDHVYAKRIEAEKFAKQRRMQWNKESRPVWREARKLKRLLNA